MSFIPPVENKLYYSSEISFVLSKETIGHCLQAMCVERLQKIVKEMMGGFSKHVKIPKDLFIMRNLFQDPMGNIRIFKPSAYEDFLLRAEELFFQDIALDFSLGKNARILDGPLEYSQMSVFLRMRNSPPYFDHEKKIIETYLDKDYRIFLCIDLKQMSTDKIFFRIEEKTEQWILCKKYVI
ncbi:MAG: hypothetical protein Tsb0015_06500 [Simkaniaceae bacterium]